MPQDKKAAKERYNEIRRKQLAASPKLQAAAASKWPVTRCLMAGNWQNAGSLMSVLIVRTHPTTSQAAIALFLIDLACMGIKSANARFSTLNDIKMIEDHLLSMPPVRSVAPGTAVMLLNAALGYAQTCGIDPDPDFSYAKLMLSDITPEPQAADIQFGGPDGKPLYVNGPEDNVEAILHKLTQKLGPDGFHYVDGRMR